MAYAQPSSPQTIGGVIDDGIRLFASAFRRCWLLAIIPGLVLAAYETAFPVRLPIAAALKRPELLAATYLSPRMLTMNVLSFVLFLVFQGAVVVREIAVSRDDPSCTFGRAIERSVRRLPGMILASILYGLAVLGGLIALVIAGGIVAAIVPGFVPLAQSHRGLAILLGLVLLAFGLLLTVRLQLWTVALFAEDASATGALGASWRLTSGHWWRAATIFSVAVIMVIVLTMCFSLVSGTIAAVTLLSTPESKTLVALVPLAANAISYPLAAAIWLAMYHDFKLRREGADLESRVGALDGTS